ncbi:uncharacterized protein LOC119671016 [Teleopsis dalmanni]|uniref:uncharacterized protein LOC119671016 n=1 Tax=Teleopsis dalmanni TaxID=139649 RepID=UPI0018CCF7CA|nr:uncharacterized protein LOC119671016 [Teleopsis dalmanni]
MHSWLEILSSSPIEQAEFADANERIENNKRSKTRNSNRRQHSKSNRASGNVGSTVGVFGSIGAKFNRFEEVGYSQLSERDAELGNNSESGEYSSSSVEDLFVSRPHRKVRKKMQQRGGYPLRNMRGGSE